MSNFKFGKKSMGHLTGSENGVFVNSKLQELCLAVLSRSPIDFMIVDGVRTIAEQKINVKKGYSKTMKSKHLLGRAIDFAPILSAGLPNWENIDGFKTIGKLFKVVAKEMKLDITWGGDWTWKDWGHIQLN